MQQVFWNLPTRTKTHVWEILGNPVNPAGVNLDVPFFPTPSSFYQGCDISSGCHQVVKIHKVFIKFSPGFHEAFSKSFHQAALGFQTDFDRFFDQVFTRFWKFTRFSPSFHQVFTKSSPGFHQVFKIHQVFTKFSPSFHQVFTKFSPGFHQVFTQFSASFHQVFTKFSPGFHQVFTRFSPGIHQVFTRFSPSFHPVLKIHQVFTRFWKFTKFSPGFHQVLVQWDFRSIATMKTHNFHQKVGSKHFFWWIWNL